MMLLSDVVTFLSSIVVLTPNGQILVGATIDSLSEMGIVHPLQRKPHEEKRRAQRVYFK